MEIILPILALGLLAFLIYRTVNKDKPVPQPGDPVRIKVKVHPNNSGTVEYQPQGGGPKGDIFDRGVMVSITAKPAPGFEFRDWSYPADANRVNPLAVIADQNLDIKCFNERVK